MPGSSWAVGNEQFLMAGAPLCSKPTTWGRAGAWVAPLLVSQEVGKLLVHGSAEGLANAIRMVPKRADGKPFNDGNGWGDPHSLLDPSHPDAARWLAREVGRLREDGMRYVKIDFNTFSEPRGWCHTCVGMIQPHARNIS